jgi:chromosome condensin MukBEF MukE localization factor
VLNIELYDYLLTMTDDAQLTKVLNNLRSASLDSHLPAFEAAAANGGTLENFTRVQN